MAVEKRGETVVICRSGKPIAELRAIGKALRDPLLINEELGGTLLYDPTEMADSSEWPEEAR